MPSFRARVFGFILRTTGMVRKNFTGGPGMKERIAAARAAKPELPSLKQRAQLDITAEVFQGHDVWTIAPQGHSSARRMLYFHGGGYIYAASKFHWDFLCHLADKHGIAIIAPLYPLAPENDVARTTQFALDLYEHLLTRHKAADLVIGGDSAGAGLAAATLMAARDAGLPMPAKALLICPWLDAVPDHPDQVAIEKRDAILTISGIRDAGRLYAREAGTDDPRVSPIHGSWIGLPPLLAFGGADDILVVDARALKAKVPSVEYVEGAEMLHDWPIFVLPESRVAQARMAEWVAA